MLTPSLGAVRVQAHFTPTLALIPNLGMVAVLAYGGTQAAQGSISVGEFASFFTYALLLVGPASTVAYWMTMVQQAVAAAERVREVLDHPPAVASASGAAPLDVKPPAVAFRGVSTSRADSSGRLDEIDLEIGARRTVAVTGAPGAGQAALLGLVNRLYDPVAGTVEVDGLEARELELPSLRRSVASALDDDFLFATSIRDNIAYGRPDAGDAEIRAAAERAQAAEFIDRLDAGYETPVGNRGRALSGGQRERVALARALLAAPGVLMLNNATGSLDAHTAAEALRDLAAHMDDWTTVMVAYSARALDLADEVVVLRDGRIWARGSHRELMADNPYYRSLIGVPEGPEGDGDER
jgi:ATP-binding cassette subfamily B protein